CVIDAAPAFYRGGNSRHTRNFRVAHSGYPQILAETYSKAEFLEDLFRVSGEDTNRELAQLTVNNSRALLDFYQAHGVAFQPALTGTLSLSKSNAFFLGGGRAMLNALYRAAERQGVAAFYDSEIMYLDI